MFSLAKVLFLKIAILFTSLILCLLLPRKLRENSESTPCDQKVLFVNICHLHWLFSARGYPREFPSVPFRSLWYIWYCRPYWLLCSAGSPKRSWRFGVHFAVPSASKSSLSMSIIPNGIRVFL